MAMKPESVVLDFEKNIVEIEEKIRLAHKEKFENK